MDATTWARVRNLLLLAITTTACGGGGGDPAADGGLSDGMPPDAAVAPALRNPVDWPDDQLATEALRLLGSPAQGGTEFCNGCHGLTRQKLRHWRALSDQSIAGCLTDLSIATGASAQQMIDCLRDDPSSPTSVFAAHKLGIYSAASHLAWFEFAFWRAYGEGAGETAHADFVSRVGMPKGELTPYTQPEFDIVAEWFARGLPRLDDLLPNDPPPDECTAGVSADVGAHVSAMSLTGWRAVNADNGLLMHGCLSAATALDCLSSYPRAGDQPDGAGWEHVPGSKLRVLRTIDYKTNFWTRSSADGRFVAHGASDYPLPGATSAIIDLASDTVIPTSAYYDPAFFPDNSGFVFQGWRAFLCNHSLLTSGPASIDYQSPECTTTRRVGLYEHVGTALGGGDYWTVAGPFESDNHGFEPRITDPDAPFTSTSEITLTPLIHDGANYLAGDNIDIALPFEGDPVISPSARLMINRVAGPDDQQLGFVLRRVDATPGAGGYTVQTPEIARYCINGGKPAFSYDERWMVLHHYIGDDDATELGFEGPTDPGFADYRIRGAANVYLVELTTGAVTRVTHMGPGQYALFPHFRSDGWIYFVVRTEGITTEYVVASDAALVLEAQ